MGGWGEAKGPSAELVARAEERRTAEALAATVASFLRSKTTRDRERMTAALDRYREVRST